MEKLFRWPTCLHGLLDMVPVSVEGWKTGMSWGRKFSVSKQVFCYRAGDESESWNIDSGRAKDPFFKILFYIYQCFCLYACICIT